jgi:hypothetical protein
MLKIDLGIESAIALHGIYQSLVDSKVAEFDVSHNNAIRAAAMVMGELEAAGIYIARKGGNSLLSLDGDSRRLTLNLHPEEALLGYILCVRIFELSSHDENKVRPLVQCFWKLNKVVKPHFAIKHGSM